MGSRCSSFGRGVLLFVACASLTAAPSAQQAIFRSYTVDQGLSQSQVETVVQDRRGYLWAGTYHGVSRFDGHGFRNFTSKDGLLENVVTASLVDRRGGVWFGHPSGGLSRYAAGGFKSFPSPADAHAVTSIIEDASGALWVGTAGGGLWVLGEGREGRELSRLDGAPDGIQTLYLGDAGLWIGATQGLFVIPHEQLAPSKSLLGTTPLAIRSPVLGRAEVHALWEDGEGKLWIGTRESGVFVLREHRDSAIELTPSVTAVRGLPDAPVQGISGDGRGKIWVATAGDGVWSFVPRIGEATVTELKTFSVEDGLPYDDVREIMLDREGNVWFAIYGGGIAMHLGERFETTRHSDNPLVLGVWSLIEDRDGVMWFGTDGGLVRFDRARPGQRRSISTTFNTSDGLCHDVVRALHLGEHGYLWLATRGGGLCRFDPETYESHAITSADGLPDDELLSIVGGEDGAMWIGTYQGIIHYRPPDHDDLAIDPGSFEYYPLNEGSARGAVYSLLRDSKGTIWAGATDIGLMEFVPAADPTKRGSFRVHAAEQGLKHLAVDSIVEDHDGLLWVSADDGGLYSFDGERFTDVGSGSALSGENVYLVACDKYNNIFAGTNHGLYKYDRQSCEFTYFGRDEGFWGIETNVNAVYNDRAGGVWFGTINGATRHDPDADRPNTLAPLLNITGLSVFLEPVPLQDGATFAHDQNHFTFEFVGISTSAPTHVRYRYMLAGFDRDWLAPTGLNTATYSNLPPGDYEFRVMAVNNNNVWTEQPVVHRFSIRTPYWKAWWFFGICVLFGVAATAGLYRWRARSWVVATRLLEEKVRDRTIELSRRTDELENANGALVVALEESQQAVRAKAEFLANMSHEIRTPMNGVVGMTDLLLETALTQPQQEYAGTVRKSAEALLEIIDDLLDFSKIEAGKIVLDTIPFDLHVSVVEVVELLAPQADAKGIELSASYDPELPRRLIGDPGRIRQLLTNLMANAVKFTERGHVRVRVRQVDGNDANVLVEVEDTGIGIPEEKRATIFEKFTQADTSATRRYGGTGLGLAICSGLVDRMEGEIGVDSCVGRGSTFWFRLRLPVDRDTRSSPAPAAELVHLRLLVVVGNPVNRRLLIEWLASWKMRSDSVDSAEAVLDKLRAAHCAGTGYDIVLIDNDMTDPDGEALGKAIRCDPLLQGTAMILLTSVGRQEVAERIKLAGFAGYLTKPVRPSQLYAMLATVQGAREAGESVGLVTRHTLGEIDYSSVSAPRTQGSEIRARALVAEDNLVNQRLAVLILERLGCQVDVAANGCEAVEMVGGSFYDVVFMDCQMPELDGYEATREIRLSQPSEHRVPVIAMTANVMPGDRERCLESGMDDYIAKPVRPEHLEEALARWVPRAEGHEGRS